MSDDLKFLEAYRALDELSEKEIAYLVKQDIHPDALAATDKLYRVMAATVVWDGVFFSFTPPPGRRALIFVCQNEQGDVADLAAWSPSEGRTALWRGEVSMLGEEAVLLPRAAADALWVHLSPLEWLQHRRAGVVVLNFDRARPLLVAASPVSVHTKEMKAKLDAAWQAPRVRVVDVGQAETVLRAV